MIREGSEHASIASRPDSVVWYERLASASVATGLASAAADPATFAKYYNLYPIVYPIIFVCSIAGQLLWIWLIARKRQNWARWISLVAMIIGIPGVVLDIDQRLRHNSGAAIAFHLGYSLLVGAVALRFRRDAREWFARTHFASDT
jgi:FtsH-binding integral membrane protein